MSELVSLGFEKWEGLGNDFVLVRLPQPSLAPLPSLALALCDRHRGIGADGVLFVDESGDDPRMIVLNADGSRPEMCGNGLRCVAGFLAQKRGLNETDLLVKTDAGDKRCHVKQQGDGLYDVAVDMGFAKQGHTLSVEARGETFLFDTVDVGNPHAIRFEPFTQEDVDHVGPLVEKAPPGGTNVEFCRVREEDGRTRIDVVVWERGVGRTQACGTGACAVAAAACEAGMASFGVPMDVVLPGGALEITVDEQRALRMKGPARRVFSGTIAVRAVPVEVPCR